MIKKRNAKTSNRNMRKTEEEDNSMLGEVKSLDNQSNSMVEEQVIGGLLAGENIQIPTTTSKSSNSNVLDLMGMYGTDEVSPHNDREVIKIQGVKKPEEENVSYQPREKRNSKQSTTFSTSDLKKRKRNIESHKHGDIVKNDQIATVQYDEICNDHIVPIIANEETNMPDDITIQAIKMRRKKLREGTDFDTGEADTSSVDYIPLEYMPEKAGLGYKTTFESHMLATSKDGEITLHKHQEAKSRLVREDDEIEDNIDEIINRDEEVFESWKDSKIKFGQPNDDRNKGDQKESIGILELDDTLQDEDVDDEKMQEFNDFELKQMRNAGINLPESRPKIYTQANLFKSSDEIEKEEKTKEEESRKLEESINRFNSKKDDITIIDTFENVEKQLLKRMKELEISHTSSLQVVLNTNSEMETSAKTLSQLTEDIDQYKEQYEYFQEMSGFVDSLSDLLDTKLPELDMLESQILDIQERYYRQLYEKSFHGHVAFVPSYREDEHERAAIFGGDGTTNITFAKFLQEVFSIVEKLKRVFDDADEEYYNLPLLKTKFEGWKSKYPSLYRDTYCSLCLHKLFSAFLRYELFSSGCLIDFTTKENDIPSQSLLLPAWSVSPLLCTTFSEFEFWKQLCNYGESSMSEEEETILPEIIRKSMSGYILHTLSKIYNPIDITQTVKVVDLIKEYTVYIESVSHSKEDIAIVNSVIERLCECIHYFKFPSIVQDPELAAKYIIQAISIISQSVIPWFEIYPSLEKSDKLRHEVIDHLINSKLIRFIDYSLSNKLISGKEKIKYLMQIAHCKLPAHWKQDLHLSID